MMISVAQLVGAIVFLAGVAGLLCVWKVPAIGLFWSQLKDKKTTGYVLYGAIAIIGIALIALYPPSLSIDNGPMATVTPTPVPTVLPTVPTASNGESQTVVEQKLQSAIDSAKVNSAHVAAEYANGNSMTEAFNLAIWLTEVRDDYVSLLNDYDTVIKYATLDKEFNQKYSTRWDNLESMAGAAMVARTNVKTQYNGLVDNYNGNYGQYYGYKVNI